ALGHEARLADDVFEYFELFEAVADEEDVLFRKQKSEKGQYPVFRFRAIGAPVVCIVFYIVLGRQDHAGWVEQRAVEMKDGVRSFEIVGRQLLHLVDDCRLLTDGRSPGAASG